VTLDTGRGS
jgi:hypothetical protein